MEEDIKIVEEYLRIYKEINEKYYNYFVSIKEIPIQAIENILEEIERLSVYDNIENQKYLYGNIETNYIPTSVIQNKLSEIDEKIKNYKSLQELHELQAQKFILELILEKGNN